jgi:predicted acyl esterase
VLRAKHFRPVKDGKYPVILSYGPYAKSLAFRMDIRAPGSAWRKSILT